MGIEVLLDLVADAAPERGAHGPAGGGGTFAELSRRTAGGARLLGGTGARHVAYLGVQGPAFTAAVFAAARAGLPFTPLNYRLADHEIAELLGRLDAPAVLVDPAYLNRLPEGTPRVLDTAAWFAESAVTPAVEPPGDPSDVAVMLFTSGTTSRPKGVLLRHDHLMAYVLQTADPLAAVEDECALVCVPPYHVAGVASALSNTYAGRRVVHLPGFTPDGWLDTVRAESVTSALVVPTMLTRVVRALDGRTADVPSLRTLAYGGAKISASVLERALDAFPDTGFVNAYGLTETSSTITVLGPEDHRRAVASGDPAVHARLGSAGRAVPGVELLTVWVSARVSRTTQAASACSPRSPTTTRAWPRRSPTPATATKRSNTAPGSASTSRSSAATPTTGRAASRSSPGGGSSSALWAGSCMTADWPVYETHPHRSEAMIHLAMIDLMSRRLARESTMNWRGTQLPAARVDGRIGIMRLRTTGGHRQVPPARRSSSRIQKDTLTISPQSVPASASNWSSGRRPFGGAGLPPSHQPSKRCRGSGATSRSAFSSLLQAMTSPPRTRSASSSAQVGTDGTAAPANDRTGRTGVSPRLPNPSAPAATCMTRQPSSPWSKLNSATKSSSWKKSRYPACGNVQSLPRRSATSWQSICANNVIGRP